MINKKLTALITSAIMMMSTSTAAMTGFNTIAADNTAAASEEEHKVCCNCGKELPDNALPTALGVYVCSDCRAMGMGGTTTGYTTTSVTTQTIGTITSTGPSGSFTTPPVPVTIATTTDPTGYSPELHSFYVYVVNTDTNKVESGIDLDIEYEDGTTESIQTFSDGRATWIDSHGKEGGVYLGKLPDHLIGGGQVGHSIPEDGEGVILYVRNNPDFAYDEPSTTTLNYVEGTNVPTTTTFVTTTVPIKGEEMAVYARSEDYSFISGAKFKITYDDGSTKVITTNSTSPVMIKQNGQSGTIELMEEPAGFELKKASKKSIKFNSDTQFLNFDFKDVSDSKDFIVVKYEGNRDNYYVKPGQQLNVSFMANGVEILSIESEHDFIDVKQWFTAETYPNHDTYAIVKISKDSPYSDPYFGNGYSIAVTYRPYDSESVFTKYIYFYISDGLSGTTTSTYPTTTTTSTTTVVYTETTVIMDYATKAEYDDSPMKIGEIRPIRFYHPATGTATGSPDVECTSDIATITWDGADIVYVYATGAGKIEVYIREADCAFGTYANLTVLDEKFDGTNTTTATTTTTETTTFDTETTTTTTSRLPGQGVELYDFEGIVIAIDDSGIEFEGFTTYPLTDYSASQFEHVKPGDKIHAKFLCDTYENYFIMNAFTVEVLDQNCPVEATEKGDANCDGELNLADAVLIMQCESNPDKYGIGLTTGINLVGAANCDVDGSGDITNKDALKIQQYKLGIIKKI